MLRPFALLSLFNAIIIVLFGEFIFLEDKKNSLNRLYMIFSFIVAGWAFCQFMMRGAQTFEVAFLWNKILAFFWPFSTPVFFHLVLIFTQKTKLLKSKWIYFVLYTPATVTSIVDFTTELISTNPILEYWGWTYTIPTNDIPYFLAASWLFTLGLVSLIITFHFYLTTKNPIKKRQARLLSIGFLIPVSAAFVTELLLPTIGIRIPELTTTFMAGMIIVIGYAIAKYELFIINPIMAAKNIVSTMSDSLVITNSQGQIIDINKATTAMLDYTKTDLKGKKISSLFKDTKKAKEKIKCLTKEKKSIINYESEYLAKNKEIVPVLLSFSTIYTKRKKLAGIVCIAKNITDRKRAEEAKKLEEVKQVYVDVFFAVTGEKLVLMTKEELEKALGQPIGDAAKIKTYEELSEARLCIRKTTQKEFAFIKNLEDVVLAIDEALTNALKHASNSYYQIFRTKNKAQFLIGDYGPGIDFKSLPKATLLSGYSTKRTLGVGFNIMLNLSDRILLSTEPKGTEIVLEIKNKESVSPPNQAPSDIRI